MHYSKPKIRFISFIAKKKCARNSPACFYFSRALAKYTCATTMWTLRKFYDSLVKIKFPFVVCYHVFIFAFFFFDFSNGNCMVPEITLFFLLSESFFPLVSYYLFTLPSTKDLLLIPWLINLMSAPNYLLQILLSI